MSMVANLNKEEMTCWCPACGEIVDVDESDFNQVMDNGDKEYSVYCPFCGQNFYAAESYNNDEWEARKYEEGINSKFHIGQTVFAVVRSVLTKREPCPACGGNRSIRLNDGKFYTCPKCHGMGYAQSEEPEGWRIAYESTVGKVQVEIYKTSFEETYMLVDTGVGSGRIWYADKLFATKEEAEKFCRKMNKGVDIEIDAREEFKKKY